MSSLPIDTSQHPDLESQHVHQVYEHIAQHFSQTRYKPWPVIDLFLQNRTQGDVGADVGCGNGKYLGLRKDIVMLGSDRCFNLARICRDRQHHVLVADNLSLPFRSSVFDFCISIAVIHHFSSPERRLQAIQELCRITKSGGEILIFVWAFEQKGRRKFLEQDVFVPWEMSGFDTKNCQQKDEKSTREDSHSTQHESKPQIHQRYYHLFKEGELESIIESGCRETVDIVKSGYDKDNWFVILRKK